MMTAEEEKVWASGINASAKGAFSFVSSPPNHTRLLEQGNK